jgi:acyl-CoA synthetase (AMP-forming)/AMP-acid ligase II
MLLGDLIDQTVRDHGPRIAVDFMGRTWTYRALGRMIERAARGFQDLGVVKGDRIALCLPNTPYYIVLYFAALKIGAVVVNLNPLYTPGEMRHLLRQRRADRRRARLARDPRQSARPGTGMRAFEDRLPDGRHPAAGEGLGLAPVQAARPCPLCP